MITEPSWTQITGSEAYHVEPSLLDVKQIGLKVESHAILERVSLLGRRGECIGIIGPNGAGKSTFIKCISGLVNRTEGQVKINGRDLDSMSPKQRAKIIAYLPQNTALGFDFTCLEVVLMGRSPHLGPFQLEGEKDYMVARHTMTFTDTIQFATRPINTLSGGERQRVLISRALAQEPKILMLDEPTANLDIHHQLQIMDLIRRLVAGGMSALVAMHDLALAARYCDRLLLLSEGKVVAEGNPWDVLTPQSIEEVFSVKALVYTDPMTGSLAVSVLNPTSGEIPSCSGGRVHVIAGGGHGSRPMYLLREAGYQVTAGVLGAGDSDYQVAQKLDIICPCIPSFSTVDDASSAHHRALVDQADVVVVTNTQFSDANYLNLEAAHTARRLVVIEDGPFSDRDFTGGKATALYAEIRQRAVVTTVADLVDAVRGAMDSLPPELIPTK
jgi:iron complex transport system ATP-binding protein